MAEVFIYNKMKYSFLKKIISVAVVLIIIIQVISVNLTFAQGGSTPLTGSSPSGISGTFSGVVYTTIISGILQPVVKLLIALAILFFLWGVFRFMISEGDKREEGRQFMFWGVVGIFVMVSVWGLVNILTNTFKLDTSSIVIPSV